MDDKVIKTTQAKQINVQPLLWLPESSVAIFPDKIIKYTKDKGKNLSSGNLTMPSLVDLEQTDLVISFSKNDVAFKIQEDIKRVKILKVKNQKVELEFQITKQSQLILVQEIMRRKLCEIGFEQKFTIIKQLGKGATAKVYLVERKNDKKKFAAKIMSLKVADNKDYQTFVNQSKILKCLKSPYIVTIQSLYISKKQLISVLEYLEGGTLLDQLKNDMVKTDRQKIKVISDIAEGVEHLRQKRIVHRDLKLQNIMVRINKDLTKDYVITDFGLACWIGQKDLLFQKCGTPGYIAPEILKANKSKVIVSHISDIFSLGVIAHFVFLLRAVFPYNGDPKELLLSNKKAAFSLQTKYHLQLMSSQLRLLQKTLSLDVDKRPNSRDLLDIYIKECQKDAIVNEMKKKKGQPKPQKNGQQEVVSAITSTRKNILRISNSIEAIEKRQASVQKQLFPSQKMKTQGTPQSERRSEKKQGSVGKLLSSVWNKITSSKSQQLKKKAESKDRKKQMKTFIKPD